ncbi:DDE-type integrase/transposase/recombinase [Phenylobacterium sp.]|jgi:transposase-like protein|uniref:DDE-type integrase/transposase/recombinase n=1 Tax=Phenylobacterium sp. TaxID=1871053 RepID=UPI0039C8C241
MGEVQNVLVQKRRNKHAALKLLRRLLRNQAIHPETITTDKLASYRAAALAGLSGGRLIPYQKRRFSQF